MILTILGYWGPSCSTMSLELIFFSFHSWRAAERIRQHRSERLRLYYIWTPVQRWCSCQEKLICMSSCLVGLFAFSKLWPLLQQMSKLLTLCVTSVTVHKKWFPWEIQLLHKMCVDIYLYNVAFWPTHAVLLIFSSWSTHRELSFDWKTVIPKTVIYERANVGPVGFLSPLSAYSHLRLDDSMVKFELIAKRIAFFSYINC